MYVYFIYVCLDVYMYLCVWRHSFICMYTYVFIYIHIYIFSIFSIPNKTTCTDQYVYIVSIAGFFFLMCLIGG